MTTPEYFGKRPNWILKHPTMCGNAYAQAIYTHLRGMSPQRIWKSERALARTVAEETGFTESICRKTISSLKSTLFVTLTPCGKLDFGTEEVVTGVTNSGYRGSQSGYGGNHYMASEQEERDTREVEKKEILEMEGIETTSLSLQPVADKVHEGGKVILGADSEGGWDTPPAKPVKLANSLTKPNEVRSLLAHFNFVARSTGSTPVKSDHDCMIFSRHLKQLLGKGHTPVSVRETINQFFQNPKFRSHPVPWKLFISSDIQRTLVPSSPLAITDEILAWVANDFDRDGASLPWSEDFDTVFRTLVLRRGLTVAYRYPDLLASIARQSHADADIAATLLALVSTLIDNLLNNDSSASRSILKELRTAGVELPNDLSPSTLRKESMTIREAVLAIPRS